LFDFIVAAYREACSEMSHIKNVVTAGRIAATHSFFKSMCAVNGGAVHSTSIEISDATFISA
jgi:hypothetical protein